MDNKVETTQIQKLQLFQADIAPRSVASSPPGKGSSFIANLRKQTVIALVIMITSIPINSTDVIMITVINYYYDNPHE